MGFIMPLTFILVNVSYCYYAFYECVKGGMDGKYVNHTWKVGNGKPIFFAFFLNVHDPHAQKAFWHAKMFVSSFEVAAMTGFILKAISVIVKFNFCVSEEELNQYGIWHELYEVACNIWRTMTNFSGMKTMVYLNHMTIGPAFGYYIADMPKDATRTDLGIAFLCFISRRLVVGLLGLMAFLIKLSQVTNEILDEAVLNPNVVINGKQALIVVPFMIQVFGITQLWRINEARFFLTVFGGSDASMQQHERDQQCVFQASVAYTIFNKLFVGDPSCGRKRALALIAVHNSDLQLLVVDDTIEESKSHSYGSMEDKVSP
jgi:hypothetical protein